MHGHHSQTVVNSLTICPPKSKRITSFSRGVSMKMPLPQNASLPACQPHGFQSSPLPPYCSRLWTGSWGLNRKLSLMQPGGRWNSAACEHNVSFRMSFCSWGRSVRTSTPLAENEVQYISEQVDVIVYCLIANVILHIFSSYSP